MFDPRSNTPTQKNLEQAFSNTVTSYFHPAQYLSKTFYLFTRSLKLHLILNKNFNLNLNRFQVKKNGFFW